MKRNRENVPIIGRSSATNLTFQEHSSLFEDGTICLIDKPRAWTSFDIVNKLRYACRARRVGHAGTLDPFATGLLIVCTGRATKMCGMFMDGEKTYEGTLRLGQNTSTDDLEGTLLGERPYPEHVGREELQHYCAKLTGTIMQRPPSVSAIRVNGVRSYHRARRGELFTLDERSVMISEFTITQISLPEVGFRVSCSKGTYVRALARDLGELLNCGAHLTSLRRMRIGEFSVDDAFDPDHMAGWMKRVVGRA